MSRADRYGPCGRGSLRTATTSAAGTIPPGSVIDIVPQPYSFWPMIHADGGIDTQVVGSQFDVPGHILGLAGLSNNAISSKTYDWENRYVVP